MRGSTVILNEILLHLTVGIKVFYVCCNMDVNKNYMFGNKMPQIPVPLIRGHLQCRDTFAWPDRCPYKIGSTVMQNSLGLNFKRDPKIAQHSKCS